MQLMRKVLQWAIYVLVFLGLLVVLDVILTAAMGSQTMNSPAASVPSAIALVVTIFLAMKGWISVGRRGPKEE